MKILKKREWNQAFFFWENRVFDPFFKSKIGSFYENPQKPLFWRKTPKTSYFDPILEILKTPYFDPFWPYFRNPLKPLFWRKTLKNPIFGHFLRALKKSKKSKKWSFLTILGGKSRVRTTSLTTKIAVRVFEKWVKKGYQQRLPWNRPRYFP